MSYSFAAHHIFPRQVMERFSGAIDALFGGAGNNPFHLDANSNKILLASDPVLANALAVLTQTGSNPFRDIGVGDAAHPTDSFHPGLNQFLIDEMDSILSSDRLPTPEHKIAALFDLFHYAKQLALSGQPPLSTATFDELTGDFGQNKVPDADLLTDTTLQTALNDFMQAELDPANLNRFSDLGDPVSNYEFRKAMAIDLLQKALDSGAIHDNLKPIYEARIDALENGTYKASTHSLTISRWIGEAASEIAYHKGIADSSFILPDLDPNSITDQPPKSPAPETLLRFEAEVGLASNLSDTIDKLDGIEAPHSAPTTPVTSINPDGLVNKFTPAVDHIVRISDSLSPNGAGVLVRTDLTNLAGDFLRSVDGALGKLQAATSLTDFARISNSIVDAFKYLHGGVADALASVKLGPLLAFAGSIGDLAELGIAAGKAYDLAAAGDWSGAAETMLNATSNLALSSAASILGGIAAVALGATGGAVIAAMLAAGVVAGLAWDNYLQVHADWLDGLVPQWNPAAIDPLVIDLDRDGIELTALGSSAVRFDLDGDGFAERTAWVAPDDGLLAVDRNGNGRIDDISELFGSPTATGYQKLAEFDTNGNGIVNAQDANFSQLRIWRDLDGDGETDAGELQTLTEAGITSLSLNPAPSSLSVNGNRVIETATVTMTNGTTTQSGEALFNLSQVETSYIMPENFTYDSEVFSLPTLRGFGEIADLWVAMSEDTSLKQDARDLIATARAGDFAGFKGDFDGFLANWANVEDAVWWQQSGLEIYFAYDHDHLHDFHDWKVFHPDVVIDGVIYPGAPYPGPTPSAKAFYFGPGGGITSGYSYDPDEFSAWISDNDLEIAYFLEGSAGFWGFPVTTYQSPSVVVQGSSNGRTYRLEPATFGDASGAPDMNAADFAFLEKLMGQDYRIGTNYFAPDNVIVTTPEEDQVDDLKASYNEVKDYMVARFLAQAAWSIVAEEGDTADLGALEPFRHVFYNPFEDKVVGDIQSLASELITDFRNDPLGTDAGALDLLRLFVPDFRYLGAYVATEFPDLDRALLAVTLDTGQLLEGTGSNETLSLTLPGTAIGYGGDDVLSGSSGVDVLMGGAGNDTMSGGAGGDFYLIDKDEGNDRISETGGSDDTIRFASGIALADLLAVFSNSDGDEHTDLTFSFANASGSFTIEDMLSQTSTNYSGVQTTSQIEWFEFADGTRLSRADFLRLTYFAGTSGNDDIRGTYFNDTISGGLGNDVLQGGAGDDTYLVDLGQGDDRIVEGGGANDTIRFAAGIALADLLAVASNADGDEHTDLTFSFANGSGSFTIEDMLSQTSTTYSGVQTASQIEWFEFAGGTRLSRADFLRLAYFAGTSGNDDIRGTYFNDTISGGLGNDVLQGGAGDDTYLVDLGQGDDRIVEGGGANDTIRFAAGITLADIRAAASNADGDEHADLTFSFTNGSGSFTIEDMLSQTSTTYSGVQTASQIEWFEFADGTRLSRADFLRLTYFAGTSGNDDIRGTYFNDTISGGPGNDVLQGGAGDDTYLVDLGQGDDRIVEGGGANDTIRFAAGITLADIRAAASNADGDEHADLTFSFANGSGSFTIEDMLSQVSWIYSSIQTASQIEWFEFADGTRLGRADFLRQTYFAGTAGNDSIQGTYFDDTITGGAGNDTLVGGVGNDLIAGGSGDDSLSGGDGTDALQGDEGNDTLDGGAGADVLSGGLGDDTYIIDATTDSIIELAGGGIDTVLSTAGFTLSAEVENLTLTGSGGISGSGNGLANSLTGNTGANLLSGLGGDDVLSGGGGNDTLVGGAGSDTLTGGPGNDTYRFATGDGLDTITDFDPAGDSLEINGTLISNLTSLPAGVTGAKTGYDYTITFGTGDSILIKGSDALHAAYPSLFDPVVGNRALSLNGTVGVDVQNVTLSGAFTIESWVYFAPGTVIDHRDGLVSAGPGVAQDLNFYAGKLRLYSALAGGPVDKIIASSPVATGAWTHYALTRDAAGSLHIYVNGIPDANASGTFTGDFTIGMIGSTAAGVSSATFDNMRIWSTNLSATDILAGMNGSVDPASSGLLRSYGFDGDGTVITDDTGHTPDITPPSGATLGLSTAPLTGTPGADGLDGGSGSDSLNGGAGDDIISGMAGNDLLSGGTGQDNLSGGDGNDRIIGGDGDDSLDGGGGNDTLTGGIDADRFIFNAASGGVDTITDFNQLDGGGDELDLLEFQGLLVGSFAYLGTGAFTSGSDNTEARVSGNQILVDADGNGTADITVTLAGLTSASQIGAEDFLFT